MKRDHRTLRSVLLLVIQISLALPGVKPPLRISHDSMDHAIADRDESLDDIRISDRRNLPSRIGRFLRKEYFHERRLILIAMAFDMLQTIRSLWLMRRQPDQSPAARLQRHKLDRACR